MKSVAIGAAALMLGGVLAVPARAQDAAPLDVGTAAPAFTLRGATESGVLPDSVRLSDFQGKTVVLAFFFKARTKG